ncbi:MAG: hypothetical protein [Bacteriophage sp.]|nr:MAG: hypothetical protein [Bacteriophage sp.]
MKNTIIMSLLIVIAALLKMSVFADVDIMRLAAWFVVLPGAALIVAFLIAHSEESEV